MHDVTAFSEGIAQVLANYDDDEEVRQLHLEWAIDHWAAIEMRRYAPVFDKCFASITGPVEYNDLDNHAQIVEWPEAQAIAHQDQNRNFVYVRKPLDKDDRSDIVREMDEMMGHSNGEFHIYRYWEIRPEDDGGWGAEYWSDNGTEYGPRRPTLEWLVEHKGTTYNDCRDGAWIASIGKGYGTENGMIYNYADFKMALFNLRCLADDVRTGADG